MKYISVSIFGEDEKYRAGLLECVESARTHYADWSLLVYCDRFNYDVLNSVDLPATRLVLHQERSQGFEGASWRFFASMLPDTDVVIFRDVDSVFTSRERTVVDDWLSSPFDVHLIRDHPYHDAPIMAGMFGVRGKGLACLKSLIQAGTGGNRLTEYGDDQVFLSKRFYPRVRAWAMVHTSSMRFLLEYAVPLPDLANGEDFIGAYHYVTEEQRSEYMRVRRSTPAKTLIPRSWEGHSLVRQVLRMYPREGIRYRSRWAV